ncbi:ATP-binding protein [Candidatus Finniella inopinata]|uniref:histidine kinase n=1 Tax=Candidatus Finniella inopinata TaxID=1696036 RepID=A0A4Q7DIQ2_9PROT|nr:ATP-binding protein [Candidatus Finniella inopinata]RZI46851.1 HAMP domain-containing protein [Candidatus Finniella inopinata]
MPKLKRYFRPWRPFKRFLPKSLFGRTLIILVTPLICMQVVLGYIFFDRHTETILRLLSDTIAGDIALVVHWVERDDDFKRIHALAQQNLSLHLVLEPNGKMPKTGLHRNSWLYQFLGEALDQKLQSPYYVRMDNNFIYISVLNSKGLLKVTLSRKRLFSRTTPLVFIWTTGSAILLFLVASLFMRNQIRPIRRLAQAAESFGKGDEIVSFKPEGATEVRQAGFAFQMMRDRLRRQLADRLEMLAGVSHDLRTPLTRMKLQLALMPENLDQQALSQDVQIMKQMVEGFLTYARGAGEEEIKQVDLVGLINELTQQFKDESFQVALEIPADLVVSLKSGLFTRCLTNLLENAKKYSHTLHLQVQTSQHYWQLIMDDDGPGISPQERENVFRPFYRLDSARNLDQGGVGLGLSIARDAIRSHGGQIYLRSSPLGGTRVVIQLPL